MGIECRTEDLRTLQLIDCLHHPPSASRVQAERAVTARLQGGCQVPIAAYAELRGEQLHLRALVGGPGWQPNPPGRSHWPGPRGRTAWH